MSCPEDGVVFDERSIQVEDIRTGQEYGGLRATLKGTLGRIRLSLQVDVGFGDAVTPERAMQEYPPLLNQPSARIWVYPRETFVAEKLEAMIRLGPANSRVKDVWDITALARCFDFDGGMLREAVERTFRRRGTGFTEVQPYALQAAFYTNPKRAAYWQEFQRQVLAAAPGPAHLVEAGEELRSFLGPVWDSLVAGRRFSARWPAGGLWRPGGFEMGEVE